ncbi:1-phosphofructokinase family hexose kinase [Microbacterium resistens]|uniref:1-phosphofructokinase family hexose kinase n=1 Tax=Microbacterium resistens TaxID=156977 RepID=UPI001C559A32|nr:PfkB family carbohydrate kinase [Microbacterium resistens]MBW1639870.1 1-phosphofructokinase family hexose kinase [Microbacterium resistens]
MIVTVTPNPALDLTWQVQRLIPGATHRAPTGRSRAGGKGLNVARVAHAEAAEVCAVATAGGATGEEFAAELRGSGVPHVLVPVRASTRRSVALVDEAAGDTTIVNERGTAPSAEEWATVRRAVADAVRRAASPVLVVAGSIPPGAPEGLVEDLVRWGRAAGATVIADTSGPALLRAADAGAHVLKPNAAELREATGHADPLAGAAELIRRGAELILLSQGPDGMLAVVSPRFGAPDGAGGPQGGPRDPEMRPEPGEGAGPGEGGTRILRARLAEPLAGNPTGAGDAAVAACAVLLAQGVRDPLTLLRRATAWSAAAVLMPLAGEIHPSWPQLEAALLIDSPTGHASDPRATTAPEPKDTP